LIKKILVPKEKRLSLNQILDHPWMKSGKASTVPLQLDFKKLKEFSKFSKLKTLSVSFIASQIPEKQIHELGLLFKQIDANCDGYITVDELKSAFDRQHENANLNELKALMDSIDTDKNGMINYNEFVACCL
jgi:calcium-dependent protein kinase